MKRMFFSCLIASLVSGTALADSATTLADSGTGLSTDVYFTSSTITGEIDNDGNKQDLNDGNMSIGSMVLNLNTEYQLAALVDGLYNLVGLFQQVALQGLVSLFPVPGAAAGGTQPGDDIHQGLECAQFFVGKRVLRKYLVWR